MYISVQKSSIYKKRFSKKKGGDNFFIQEGFLFLNVY
jgi:hypothetical protein